MALRTDRDSFTKDVLKEKGEETGNMFAGGQAAAKKTSCNYSSIDFVDKEPITGNLALPAAAVRKKESSCVPTVESSTVTEAARDKITTGMNDSSIGVKDQ